MADQIQPETPGADTPQQAPLTIQGQYVKDLSFEVPNAPAVFGQMQSAQPDINIDIGVNATKLSETQYEVTVTFNASCDVGGTKGFILELVYAGAFQVNVPDEHRQAVLMIECPRLLFPFARNIIADVTRDGGFPPVMLGIVDFVAMYQARIAEQQPAAGAAEGDAE
ncbi:MAG: protein-export chaperone SecB [Rhodospirillales bacterium]|nr:protein-export chaperone SecB [Rhodospirillales bacterium]MBO6787620.1 protein-export chaperone SecB [Rhodospirillales bacterium]